EAARQAPDVPLVVAGDGPLRDFVQRSAPPSVQFVGRLAPDDLADLRSRAAFVVAPSEVPEIQPFSVLEALMDAKPVVTTSMGGLPELVIHRENGLVVRPGDAVALARAMESLWTDATRQREMGAAARRQAVTRHSLGSHIEEVLGVYESVAGRAIQRST